MNRYVFINMIVEQNILTKSWLKRNYVHKKIGEACII